MKQPTTNQKIFILLILLIGSMFWWINANLEGVTRLIAMIATVVIAYWLGRIHSNKINLANNQNETKDE